MHEGKRMLEEEDSCREYTRKYTESQGSSCGNGTGGREEDDKGGAGRMEGGWAVGRVRSDPLRLPESQEKTNFRNREGVFRHAEV